MIKQIFKKKSNHILNFLHFTFYTVFQLIYFSIQGLKNGKNEVKC